MLRGSLQVWSFAFVNAPGTPTVLRIVGARPCRSCALHHLGVQHVHHSTDASIIETVSVAMRLDVAPLSLGERQLVWQADCKRMAAAEAGGTVYAVGQPRRDISIPADGHQNGGVAVRVSQGTGSQPHAVQDKTAWHSTCSAMFLSATLRIAHRPARANITKIFS